MIGGSNPSLPTKNTINNKNYLEVSNFFVIFVLKLKFNKYLIITMSFITREQAKKSEQYDNWLKENSEFLERFLISKNLKSELNFEDKVITKIIEKESKKSELQNRFVQYIGNFFDGIEEKHKLENELLKHNLK